MPSDTFFNLDFWQKFVTTLSGVALGIPAALLIQRVVGSGKNRKEQNELVQAIEEALGKHARLVQQFKDECAKYPLEWVPSYPLDITILDATPRPTAPRISSS
jgi:hypothetical protein